LITERELTAEGGFRQRVVPEKVPETGMGAGAVSFHDFKPPSLVHISQEYEENGGKFVLALYATPTKPGWVRHIGCQVPITPAFLCRAFGLTRKLLTNTRPSTLDPRP